MSQIDRHPAAQRGAAPTGFDPTTAPVLPMAFYSRPTLRVARALLGKVLVHQDAARSTAGRIVEVEAYCGPRDRAAHSSAGRRTPRNEIMWGPCGRLYVYFTYGMHYCCNVVTRPAGFPEAVLLRALEPLAGIPLMRERRGPGRALPIHRLASGPGNLCRAMGIDRALNGADLSRGPILLVEAAPISRLHVVRSARIGVAYAGADATRPWRIYVRDSPAVSGRPTRRRAPR